MSWIVLANCACPPLRVLLVLSRRALRKVVRAQKKNIRLSCGSWVMLLAGMLQNSIYIVRLFQSRQPSTTESFSTDDCFHGPLNFALKLTRRRSLVIFLLQSGHNGKNLNKCPIDVGPFVFQNKFQMIHPTGVGSNLS